MRRARINVKPNFRPGSRSGLAGEQRPHGAADADATLSTVKAEKAAVPSPPHQVNPPIEEKAEALSVKNDPQSPLEKSSAKQHNGAPSSGCITPAAVPQRRMRLSATPKLSRPRVTPAPRPSVGTPSLAALTLHQDGPGLDSTPEIISLGSMNSDNLSDSGVPHSTSPRETAVQLSASRPASSSSVPSTSDLGKPSACDEKTVEDSPSSVPPDLVPQKPPQEPGDHECSTQVSSVPSASVKSTSVNKPGSLKETDKDRILRALKLKELMKIERRKDLERTKKTVRQKQVYTAVDHSKMTMRDLIYYLPDTSPMKSSVVNEEDQAEVIVPPSPKLPGKTQETDEEEAESENEGMLMPKVRVAEDGSIILDEDSLTVRIQRTSNTAVIENSNPLFERGSTTTYTSFRNVNYTKSWSVRETDMFFLAISMVGTDFSLIGQLLPHRSRLEIKNKFKREEKSSAWRIDKAFKNKRPYDRDFFGFLLERVLAKDKEKGASVKLVMTQSRTSGKARGKRAKKSVCEELFSGGDDDVEARGLDMEDDGHVHAEKENENLSNVNEMDLDPATRKRKRTRCRNEANGKEDLTKERVKKKKRTRSIKTPEGTTSPHTDAEGDSGLFNLKDDTANEDELDSNTSASKKKRKTSRKGAEEGEAVNLAKGRKGSRRRKSLKDNDDHESNNANESSIAAEDQSVAITKKCKRSSKCDLKTAESTKGKKSTKRGTLKGKGNEETKPENGDASTTGPSEADKNDSLVTAKAVDVPQQKSVRSAQKPKPNLSTRRRKRSIEPEATELDEIQAGIGPVEKEHLQKEPEVVMERTPPRENCPSKVQSKESEVPVDAPACLASTSSSSEQMRMQRAESAKRNLTLGRQKRRRILMVDHEDSEHDLAAENKENPAEQTQDSEDSDIDNTLDEKPKDYSCVHALDSPMFQRRPLVMLSREEVDMIVSVREQTAAEQPSPSSSPPMSPLDLSLNTELSFQISNLMEENAEASQDECVVEGPPEDPQSAVLESHWEDLEMMESSLADLSSTRHFSTTLSADSKYTSIASEDLACTKPNALGIHKITAILMPESETFGTSSATQDFTEANKTSVLALVRGSELSPSGVSERSQEPVVAATETGDRPQKSVSITPETKEDMKESPLEPDDVLEGSQESVVTLQENTQGSVMLTSQKEVEVATPEIKEGSQASLLMGPEIRDCSVQEPDEKLQEAVVPTTEIMEGFLRSQKISEIKEVSEGSLLKAAKISEKSQEIVGPTPEIMEGLQASEEITTAIKEDSQRSLVETPQCEVIEGSQESVVTIVEIKVESEVSQMSGDVTPEITEGSVLIIPKFTETLQGSHLEPSEVLKRSLEIPKIKEGSQESELLDPKIKQMPEGSDATTTIIKEEKIHDGPPSTKSSGTSVSSEHGVTLKRRSRFLKPKPNLNLASRILHCSPKQKCREANKTVSSEELFLQSPASDQQCELDDFSKESISKKKRPHPSSSVDNTESKPVKVPVPSGSCAAVVEQEQKSTTVTLSEVCAPVPQRTSHHTGSSYDVDPTPACQSVAKDLQKMDAPYVWPLPSLTTEQEITGQMAETYEDVCAPAKLIHSAGDGQSDEEPTFILTLYEIPVTQADLTLGSNDSAMMSDLHPAEVQSPPMTSILSSTSDCPRSTCLPINIGETEKECVGTQNESSEPLGTVTKDLENFTLDLPTTQEKSAGFSEETPDSLPEREGSLSTEAIKETQLTDIPTPLATYSQDTSNISSVLEEKAAPEPVVNPDQQGMQQAILQTTTLQAKNKSKELSAKWEAEDILSVPNKEPQSLCEESSELEDLKPKNQSTPLAIRFTKCVKSSPQDSMETQQCEGVSHTVLADVLVPVSEEMEDIEIMESTNPEEIILHGEGCSSAVLAKTQENPSEELQKEKHPTAVSDPLLSVMDDFKQKHTSEVNKAPAKRKGKLQPKIDNSSVINDRMKTAQPVMEEDHQILSQASVPSLNAMVPQAKKDSSPIITRPETESLLHAPKLEEIGRQFVSDPPQGNVVQKKHRITPCTVSLSRSLDPQYKDIEEDKHYAGVSNVGTADVFKSTSKVMQEITVEGTTPEEKLSGIPSLEESHKKSVDRILASQEIRMPVRKGKLQMKRKCLVKKTVAQHNASQSELVPTIQASSLQSDIHGPSETVTKLLPDDAAIKHDIDSTSQDKESSGSVDINEPEEECEGVSKNYSKTARHITEQSQPIMTQAASATSDPTMVPHNKRSCDPSTKLEKADILYGPEVELVSEATDRSDLGHLEEELRKKHEIMPCTVRISKCLDAQIQQQRPPKAFFEPPEQGSNERVTKVGIAATSYNPNMELILEDKDNSVTSHEVCSQEHEAKPSAKTTCTDSLFMDSEETGPEENCVFHMALADILVPVSEEMEENVSSDFTVWLKSFPHTNEDHLTRLQERPDKTETSKLKKAAISSPASTQSDDLEETSKMEKRILEEPSVLVERSSPARMKVNLQLPFAKQQSKKNESSNPNPPDFKKRNLNQSSRMYQLPITAWTKKMSIQPETELKADSPSKKSEIKSSFKAKEGVLLDSNKSKGVEVGHQSTKFSVDATSCSSVQTPDLKEAVMACESVPPIAEMETSGDVPTLSKDNKESSEGPSGSCVKKLPDRRRANLQVKPRLLKRTCAKDEDASSKTSRPPPTQFPSPRPQRARAAKIKEESTKQQTPDLSDTTITEKINECTESLLLPSDSWLPKSTALSPRVILSRVDVQRGETSSSSSCTPVFSPAKVSTSTYQPMTPPQQMTSRGVPSPQGCSPTSTISSEVTEDEPSTVSQFFIHDIFTEIEDTD
ncbi:uncharacterized protein bdp1 isoform X3 [Brachyhypopomus gauderio]|uniref:uncharacterized protein bdp1 isoform X3 n=1 Tax=Brachyhypopomus gauderio TaxID=698409 RepID=UPI0040418288